MVRLVSAGPKSVPGRSGQSQLDGSVTDDAIHEDCPENFLIEIEENRSAVLKAVKAHVIGSIFTFLNYNLADKAS